MQIQETESTCVSVMWKYWRVSEYRSVVCFCKTWTELVWERSDCRFSLCVHVFVQGVCASVCMWRIYCVDVNSGSNHRWTLKYTVYQSVTVTNNYLLVNLFAWLFIDAAVASNQDEFRLTFITVTWSDRFTWWHGSHVMQNLEGQSLHYQSTQPMVAFSSLFRFVVLLDSFVSSLSPDIRLETNVLLLAK